MKALLISFLFLSAAAWAGVTNKNGTVTIDVSGSGGPYYGSDGTSAGSANVTVAYADAAKTQVSITGTYTEHGKSQPISVSIALSSLKEIAVLADGGDGASGEDGSNGFDGSPGSAGSNGWPGSDGCPPSSGSNGGDGSRGGDGGNGGNGGDGGNGGNGGVIQVNASPDHSELLLFVRTGVSAGRGGAGGSGGSGGAGGMGGPGGMGGAGGRNTCVDQNGNPTGGPDGSSGWNGNAGSNGNSGSNGWNGSDGRSGKSGSKSFNLVSAGGTQTFPAVFQLELGSVTFTDDLGAGILEPGERVYLSALEIVNKAAMPSPTGQTIQVKFAGSTTMIAPAPLTAQFTPVAGNGNNAQSFKKGVLTWQIPDDAKLIGKKAVTTATLNINGVSIPVNIDTGMAIHWPVTLNAAATKTAVDFEIAKSVSYSLKNAGSQALGPQGDQPIYLEFVWKSKTVPGSDVSIQLADGHTFTLANPAEVSDLTVPANGTAPMPLQLLVRDSKLASSGTGTLTVNLRLNDPARPGEELVQSIDNAVTIGLDLNSMVWNQTMMLANDGIVCQFPKLPTPAQAIAAFQVAKAKGAKQLDVQVSLPGSTSGSVSPVIHIPVSKMLSYYEAFSGQWTAQNAVDFLNKMVGPNSPAGAWNFKSCTVGH